VIGGAVALDAMWGGPLTGASMNPARSLAPALFAGVEALQQWPLIYAAAPIAGAVLAAWTYEALRDSEEHAQSAPPNMEAPRGLQEALRANRVCRE
jgi:hypothetical protein